MRAISWASWLTLLVLALPASGGQGAGATATAPGWQPDVRLTFDRGASETTFNFAKSIAADAAGRVHVVWYDYRDGERQVYYRRSLDAGVAWGKRVRLSAGTGRAEHPAVAAAGDSVLVVWHGSSRSGPDIFLRRSRDGGATWEQARRLTSNRRSAHASIAVSGENVYIVWGDTRTGEAEIWTRRSTDLGATWEEARQLSAPGFDSWVPAVAAAGDQVHVAWVDTRDGNEEEYYRRSLDGGLTWEPIRRLSFDSANSWAPSLAVDGSGVHLVWFDQRHTPFELRDAEEPLHEAMRKLGLEPGTLPAGVVIPHPVELAKRRATEKLELINAAAPAWIAAGGDAAGLADILEGLQRLGEVGASYFAKERKLDEALRLMGLVYTPGPMEVPRIYYGDAFAYHFADESEQILAAAPGWVESGGDPREIEALLREFERRAALATSEWEIYHRRSLDGGATWSATVRLTRAARTSARPSVAIEGNTLHVVWFDSRDGNFEIYSKASSSAGASWSRDTRLTRAAGDSLHPSVATAGGRVHVVWFDRRDGNAEIYYKRK